jgi:hypothetical protein
MKGRWIFDVHELFPDSPNVQSRSEARKRNDSLARILFWPPYRDGFRVGSHPAYSIGSQHQRGLKWALDTKYSPVVITYHTR